MKVFFFVEAGWPDQSAVSQRPHTDTTGRRTSDLSDTWFRPLLVSALWQLSVGVICFGELYQSQGGVFIPKRCLCIPTEADNVLPECSELTVFFETQVITRWNNAGKFDNGAIKVPKVVLVFWRRFDKVQHWNWKQPCGSKCVFWASLWKDIIRSQGQWGSS